MIFSNKQTIVHLLAALCLAAACTYSWVKPYWNWDLLCYLSLTELWDGATPEAAHSHVYGLLDQLPAADAHRLRDGQPYRTAVANDVQALMETNHFHTHRVGYIGSLWALKHLGTPDLMATQVMGVAALTLFGVVLWLWLIYALPLWPALAVFAGLLISPTVMKIGRLASADGMGAALFLSGLYLWAVARKPVLGIGAFTLSLFWRSHFIFIYFVMGVWRSLCWLKERNVVNLNIVLALGICGGVFAFMYSRSNFVGLDVLLHHEFIRQIATPLTPGVIETPVVGSWERVVFIWERLLTIHGRDLVVLLAGVAGGIVTLLFGQKRHKGLALAILIGIFLQLCAYPRAWERFTVGPMIGLVLLGISCFRRNEAK